MDRVKINDVFVPGGIPTYTYNPRASKRMEERLREVTENNKLAVVTGPTKSGKTVLVEKVFPRSKNLWIDGGAIDDEDSFWENIISELDVYTHQQISSETNRSIGGGLEGQAGGDIGIVKATGSVSASGEFAHSESVIMARNLSSKSQAIRVMHDRKIPLIIDDFHYISKEVQKHIVRALKAPVMYGQPVICIAIPNRKFDVISVERELTGRMDSIEMPVWDNNELEEIAIEGFSALNYSVKKEMIVAFSNEALGSPFLMQEFCRSACKALGITEKSEVNIALYHDIDTTTIFTRPCLKNKSCTTNRCALSYTHG